MEPTGKRPPQGGGEPLSPSSTKAKAVELPSAAAAPRSRSRTLLIITALMAAVAVVSGGGGYAIGYITAPKSMDMDAELRRIEETCTQEDLLTGETLSAECAALVDDRVRALEQLVHAGGAAEFVPSNATHGWGLCSSYDYVDYCGYCGVPMASTNPPTEI